MDSTYNRRTMIKLLGLSAGAVVLPSCVPSGDTGNGSASGGSGGSGDIDVAAWVLADDASKAGIQGLMDAYAATNDVSFNSVAIAYPNYTEQMTLQITGDQFTGGAMQLAVGTLAAFVETGRLRDLGSLTEGVGYTDTALSSGQHDGTQYGLPWTTGAIGLIANTEMLESVGAEGIPTTITEFEDLLTELKATGIIPYAASTKVIELKDVMTWMQTFGSELLVDDDVTLGDEPSVEALAWYKRLYDDGLIAPDVERIDARRLFGQGQAAMYDDAIVGKDLVADQASDPDMINKIAPYPRPVLNEGDTPRAEQWGHVFTIVDGDGADAASEFAVWATSNTDAVLEFFETVGLPPTTDEALASEAVQDDQFTADFTERITATATSNPFWRFPQYPQMETAISEQVQNVLVNDVSPADALSEARKAVQDLM